MRINAVAALVFVTAVSAFAQGWPSRQLTKVVPFAAGGPVDVLGRIVEVVSGRPLADFFAECITGPLSMADTGFAATGARAARVAEPQADPASGKRPPRYGRRPRSSTEWTHRCG